jgi:CRP/FNR family transcriptional regulator, cyclic AMP receptor protein
MSHLDWVNLAGYCASLLVFGAFYMTAMIPLRAIAIASNIAFIAYGFGHHLYPVLILHALLLPLNCLRVLQLRRSIRRVRGECRGHFSNEWLIPLMSRRTFKSGDVLFRLGDPARSMFLILSGSVRVTEIGVALGPGALVGEIGVFAADSCRTGTAFCETDVEVGSISADRALQLYCQDPTFGLYLMRLVIQRMLVGERRRVVRGGVRSLYAAVADARRSARRCSISRASACAPRPSISPTSAASWRAMRRPSVGCQPSTASAFSHWIVCSMTWAAKRCRRKRTSTS